MATAARPRVKAAAALLLTLAAGLVDILGYLGVYRLFTAHVTGTTVHLARALVERKGSAVAVAATIVTAYFAGSVLGRGVIEVASRKHIPRPATATLGLEAALIACVGHAAGRFAVGHESPSVALTVTLVACLAVSMGLQTATLTRLGPLTVHTTFVTGMLNKLAQVSSRLLFGVVDRLRAGPAGAAEWRRRRGEEGRQAAFLAAVWLAYLVGALAGALGYGEWGMRTMYVAVGLLAFVIAVDRVRNLAVEEEREQSER